MTRSGLGLSVISLVALTGTAARAEPRSYTVNPTASRIVIHVGKTGLFGFAGHEHEVVAPVSRAPLVVDSAHVEASSVELALETRSLRVTGRDEPRQDVAKVQVTMLGPECLDAARFPEIRFVSKAISATRGRAPRGGLDVTIAGTLTLHGVSRGITVQAHVDLDGGGDLLTADGSLTLKQTDFGIKPISVAGVVKVKDEVRLDLRLVAHRAR